MTQKPSDQEEEYFKKLELDKVKRLREKAAREMAAKEKEELKKLHWMQCPKCGMELAEVDFRSVLVDACFTCGGMFLDRGEIDKILQDKESGLFGRMVSTLFGE